jgi:hypothetical protein
MLRWSIEICRTLYGYMYNSGHGFAPYSTTEGTNVGTGHLCTAECTYVQHYTYMYNQTYRYTNEDTEAQHRYRRKTGYTYVQCRIRVCSLICRRAAVYSCTTQLTDIQRFLYTRYEVPQSGLVDIYAAFDVRCAMQSLVRNALMGRHCKRGWHYRSLYSNMATGGFVNSMCCTVCRRLHRALEHSINVYITG